jgi:hypothetical protein
LQGPQDDRRHNVRGSPGPLEVVGVNKIVNVGAIRCVVVFAEQASARMIDVHSPVEAGADRVEKGTRGTQSAASVCPPQRVFALCGRVCCNRTMAVSIEQIRNGQ